MRAVVIRGPGGPEVLEVRDVPRPEAGVGQVLVRVAATAVNRADLLQRLGRYPAPPGWPADIPGLEYSGTIEEVGAATSRWTAGKRVMGLVGGGSYAEYVVVAEDEVIAVPDGLPLEEAAAVPEAFITAHDALITQANLGPGESVLIHGVGSGVGTAAVQVSKAMGARTFGTARSAWKLDRAGRLGLDVAINARHDDFAEVIRRETSGRGVDVVVDLISGDYLAGNIVSLAERGRIVIVGLLGGSKAELDMRLLMRKRARVHGTVLRARPASEKARVARDFELFATPHFQTGRMTPVVDCTMPLERAAAAHERMESNENFGKIVLTLQR